VTFRKRVWPFFADDAESQTRMGAFSQTLALAGCTIGRNVRIEARWGTRDAERIHRDAVELAALAPDVTRAAVIRDARQISGGAQLDAIQAVAPLFGMELRPVDVRDSDEIERDLAAFARQPNGGLIVTAAALVQIHCDRITKLAARHRLPAVYLTASWTQASAWSRTGLIFSNSTDARPATSNRILKGEKPG
jgi:hypothetical protein